MFLNAVIFKKLERVFKQLNNNTQYFLAFAPVTTSFTNNDFNFLQTGLPADQQNDSYENQMAFAYFTNAILRNSKIYDLNNEDFLQNSYKTIIEKALLIDSSLNENEKQEFKNSRSFLYLDGTLTPTQAYEKYLSYNKQYEDYKKKINELNDKIMADPDDTLSISEKQKAETEQNIVFNDWLIDGDKEKTERAVKIVNNLNKRAVFVNDWIQERSSIQAKLKQLTTINSNIDFLPSSCLPNNLFEYNYQGWKKIVLTENELNELEQIAKNDFGEEFYNSGSDGNSDISKVEFEYLFVTVLRNWFKPELINSGFWAFSENDQAVVSDPISPAQGLMPGYIDKFIFIRRILTYNRSSNESAPITTGAVKTFMFKDFTRLKKISELRKVQPVAEEKAAPRIRFFAADKSIVAPVFMRKMNADKSVVSRVAFNADKPKETTSVKSNFMRLHSVTGIKASVFSPAASATPEPAKTNFNLTISVKDNIGNKVDSITIEAKNTKDGTSFTSETNNEGIVFFQSIQTGDYTISVKDEELYDDNLINVQLNTDKTESFFLQRRDNPRFTMYMLGAINFKFPKLPDPIPGYTYS